MDYQCKRSHQHSEREEYTHRATHGDIQEVAMTGDIDDDSTESRLVNTEHV